MSFEQTTGTRAQVWHGTAKKTSGGLTKTNLMMNKHGRIVSRRKHSAGKKSIKHLEKLGFKAKKGEFKLFHKGHKGRKGTRKMKGGIGMSGSSGNMGNMGNMGNSGNSSNSGSNTSGIAQQLIANKIQNSSSGNNNNSSGNNSSSGGLMNKRGGGRSRKMRGGMAYGGPLSPLSYNGSGVGTSGVNLQFVAGNAG